MPFDGWADLVQAPAAMGAGVVLSSVLRSPASDDGAAVVTTAVGRRCSAVEERWELEQLGHELLDVHLPAVGSEPPKLLNSLKLALNQKERGEHLVVVLAM